MALHSRRHAHGFGSIIGTGGHRGLLEEEDDNGILICLAEQICQHGKGLSIDEALHYSWFRSSQTWSLLKTRPDHEAAHA